MTAPQAGEVRQRLERLRAAYAAELPARLQRLGETWTLMRRRWDAGVFRELYRAVHGLAGACATLGCPDAGRAAQSLELVMRPVLDSGGPPTPGQRRAIGAALRSLRKCPPA